ncbi:S1C family serine protease [Adlercreutzia sp. ZJ154]|uniref:S1C family serine protease n=1 Tax=Adlercreutzia sp. ZJ154 TaxID=2709790 RepID=UPI0013EAE2E6|nr:trypsin-like peptidase domain-containing protein [Adlercreutzia sp. ZJ154]
MENNGNNQIPQGQQTHVGQHEAQSAYWAAYSADGHGVHAQNTAGNNHYASAASVPAATKKSSGAKTFLLAFAGALVACVLMFGIGAVTNMFGMGSSRIQLGAVDSTSVEAASEEASLAEAVASKCMPSVGSVTVYSAQSAQSGSIYDYLYGYGYTQDREDSLTQSGMGSCVMLSEDGYAVTNYHVVQGGSKFEVTVDGETYNAELVGDDASSDVAVLKLDGNGFSPIELGDSDDIKIGEWVMSIGSPFGLEQSVATGIVSATSRSQIMEASGDMFGNSTGEATIYPNMIQTDAAINPGNSGGALVDAQGKLIGINTLITSYSGNYSGVGFAIPANYAISLAKDIIDGKEPTHAQLGVSLTTVNETIAKRYGFSVDEGAYVSAVVPGSGAEQAGIQIGDIITKFDGQDVESASDLMLDVRTKNPGDKVTLKFMRGSEEKEVQVTLGMSESANSNNSNSSNSNSGGMYIPQGNDAF